MILRAVHYQMFDHERRVSGLESWHQLDGEVALRFDGDEVRFVSWAGAPGGYCIALQAQSFFNEGALSAVEMTTHPYWAPLIGKPIQTRYADALHEVLVLENREERLYLAAQYGDGTQGGDCIRIAKHPPC
ncbi:hypothetical protein [Chitinolyticbacter meiyuanensis]|uniref:hypothetical protein n=1 Tax=Chitinolyticbacter meiyuanensis TaxID=682798 RepID=UPI0011E59E7B|nr:hypothetical protein [Chitinolyticbacter meiyuanensis]